MEAGQPTSEINHRFSNNPSASNVSGHMETNQPTGEVDSGFLGNPLAPDIFGKHKSVVSDLVDKLLLDLDDYA
jgi:hypothetical protein